MEEKILQKNKNGMGMLLLFILLYASGIGAIVLGAVLLDGHGDGFAPGIIALAVSYTHLTLPTIGG